MRKPLAYLYIFFLIGMWIWLILSQPDALVMLAMIVILVGLFVLFGVTVVTLFDIWRDIFYRRRLKRLLGDRTLEEVLARSPYDYGYVFQGDEGYRLWRKDAPMNFVGFQLSRKDAVLWIVEQSARVS